VNIHWIYCIENIFTVQDFWATYAYLEKESFPSKFSLYWIYFLPFKIFEQLCAYPENQSLPWNFSLYSIYFLHSGILRNLRLPWKTESALNSLYWIYIFYSDVRRGSWLGRHCLFHSQISSVWINWSTINSPLNWLLAEWLVLMLSIPYHNLLHAHRYRGDSRFEKN